MRGPDVLFARGAKSAARPASVDHGRHDATRRVTMDLGPAANIPAARLTLVPRDASHGLTTPRPARCASRFPGRPGSR